MANKPQKYKETERFSIRRLVFWLSVSGVVYFTGVWDVTGMVISLVMFVMAVVSKLISMSSEKGSDNDRD
jgi:hypothetical protein